MWPRAWPILAETIGGMVVRTYACAGISSSIISSFSRDW